MAGTGSDTTDAHDAALPVRRRADGRSLNLRSNELIHPEAESVLRRVADRIHPDHLRAYPAIADRVEMLAGYFGRCASDCVVTPGSDAAIRLVCDAFARRGGRTLLLQAPNYDAWEQAARLRGLSLREFSAADACPDRQLTTLLEAAARCDDALVAVSTPNGPAGGIAPPELLDRLGQQSERNGHLLVLDGCYQCFAGPHDALLPRVGERTLVIHTLSKSHGLAGARVAMIFGTRARLQELDAWPNEQAVSTVSLLAAEVALAGHQTFCRIWTDIQHARADAAAQLRSWGVSPLPSGGNFLSIRVGTAADAAAITESLAEAGYRIRDLSPLPGLNGCIRFTVGDQKTTAAFLLQLRAAVEPRVRR